MSLLKLEIKFDENNYLNISRLMVEEFIIVISEQSKFISFDIKNFSICKN